MNRTDSDLLTRFSRSGDESALQELLRRHLAWVHAAALRRTGGDHPAAEEIAQDVFHQLARKSDQLANHPSIAGWLYESIRLAAAQFHRSESRRRRRESAAQTMSDLIPPKPSQEPDWESIRPVLDDALDLIPAPDREALLWRFFEQCSLAEVGRRLGLSENAARMRVDRALDRLRRVLAQQGITGTASALAECLGPRVGGNPPPGLAEQISAGLGRELASPPGRALLRTANPGILAVTVATMLLTGLAIWIGNPFNDESRGSAGKETATLNRPVARPSDPSPATPEVNATNGGSGPDGLEVGRESKRFARLEVTLRAAASGLPIAGGELECRTWTQGRSGNPSVERFRANRDGMASIEFPPEVTRLELISRVDGFADTQLRWVPDHGQTIPEILTLELESGVWLSGVVLDANDQPVEDAEVRFTHDEKGSDRRGIESHEFQGITVKTGPDGRWHHARIAADVLQRTSFHATHPAHPASAWIWLKDDPETRSALESGTHRSRLNPGYRLQGSIVDEEGSPVSDATIKLLQSGRRVVSTAPDGTFAFEGVATGEPWMLVEAPGYALTRQQVVCGLKAPGVRVVLRVGRVLRLRIQDPAGMPLSARFGCFNPSSTVDPGTNPPPAFEFVGKTGTDGSATWDQAPDDEVLISVLAEGYEQKESIRVRADGQEQTITLQPHRNLSFEGRVTDACTGRPIPAFRMVLGYPEPDPILNRTNARFLESDRHWIPFEGGHYRQAVLEPIIGGMPDPQVLLKFEAPGYQARLTRPYRLNEGRVLLDVSLRPARSVQLLIQTPDGQPAAGAEVGLVRNGESLYLNGTTFYRERGTDPSLLLKADGQGHVTQASAEDIDRWIVVHASGYGEFAPREGPDGGTLQLKPWARIVGSLRSTDPGIREVWVHHPDKTRGPVELEFGHALRPVNDDRRFEIPFVPPGRWQVSEIRPVETPAGPTSHQPGHTRIATPQAGETVTVVLGMGRTVRGRVRLSGGTPLPPRAEWIGAASGHSPDGDGNGTRSQQPAPRPEVDTQSPRALRRIVAVDKNGTFHIDSMVPGAYRLQLMMRSSSEFPKASPSGMRPRWSLLHDFEVPEGDGAAEIDLGVLEAKPVEDGK